jgi:uncharacterized protein (TIGR02246 family)
MAGTASGNDGPDALSTRFEEAWNSHDMGAFAELFHPDAIFISRFGHFWRGREEIVARHAEIHSTIYRDCTIANHLQHLEGLTEEAAIGVVKSRVSVGRFMPTGPRVFSSQFLYVATRRQGVWRIQAGENVAVANPETGELIADD